MLVAGFVQLVLRQMFLCLVFMSFGMFERPNGLSMALALTGLLGSFWLFFAATLQPFYAASAAYGGPDKPGFPASLGQLTSPRVSITRNADDGCTGFFLLSFSILSFFFLICGLRTNIVIEFLLLTVTLGLCLLTGLLWALADGNLKSAHDCKIVCIRRLDRCRSHLSKLTTTTQGAGACLFACSMSGLYFLLALMLPTVDFPLQLPLGDLSHIVPSMTQKTQASRTAREDTKA